MAGESLPARFLVLNQVRHWRTENRFETATKHTQTVDNKIVQISTLKINVTLIKICRI